MKKLNFIGLVLIALIISFDLSKNMVIGQITSDADMSNTYTITLSGSALKSTNALNITLGFVGGSGQLDTGISLKANGATQLLTDVNATTNLVSVVWTGSITDGKAIITGKLKAGSKTGNPTINVTKVVAAGGLDITSSLVSNVTFNSIAPSPTPSPSPSASPSPGPSASPSPTPSPSPSPSTKEPSLTISGPDTLVLNPERSNIIKLTVKGTNFTGTTRCKATSSNDIMRTRPRTFLLSPGRNKKTIFGVVSSSDTFDIIDSDNDETVTIEVTCKNGTEDELDILVTPISE